MAGWSLAAEEIRRACHAEAERLSRTRGRRLDTAERFARASGDWALPIDASKVDTEAGGHAVEVAAFTRPARAAPTSAWDHEQRDSPGLPIRSVRAAIEPAEAPGLRCRAEARRLEWPAAEPLSILGEGARSVWNLSDRSLAGAEQVLDVFHAGAYLAELARAGFGDDAASAGWLSAARTTLLADGRAGAGDFVATIAGGMPDRAGMEAEFPRVANYLAGHQGRMRYDLRVRWGQAIGRQPDRQNRVEHPRRGG